MSSLRRRAIVVSRARSAERSSTGGRVSARAAAAESPGSASTRSQAIASRTSGRWKSAAGPERWKRDAALLHRRRHRPALGRPGPRPARRSLPARCRSPAGARRRGPPPAPARARWCSARTAARGLRKTWLRTIDSPAGPARRRGPAAIQAVLDPLLRVARGRSARADSGSPSPSARGPPAGRRSPPRTRRPSGAGSGRRSRRARPAARRAVRLRIRKRSPRSIAAGLGEDPVVGRAELAPVRARQGRRPTLSASIRSSRRASRPAGLPRISWLAHRQLVEAVEQHRQPLGAADDAEERVEPGRLGSARAAGARRSPPRSRSRAPRRGRSSSDSTRRRRRRAVARVEVRTTTRSGPEALLGEPRDAPGEHLGLARSGRAEQQQRARRPSRSRAAVAASSPSPNASAP